MHMHEYSVAPSVEVVTSLVSYRQEWPHCESWGPHSGDEVSDVYQEAWIFNNENSVRLYWSNNPTYSHLPSSFSSLRDAATFKRQNSIKGILSLNDSCRCSGKSIKLKQKGKNVVYTTISSGKKLMGISKTRWCSSMSFSSVYEFFITSPLICVFYFLPPKRGVGVWLSIMMTIVVWCALINSFLFK